MFVEKRVRDFVDETASSKPVPGGGGVSALVAAMGIALGDMVGELTLGKKKYADVEEEIRVLMEKAKGLKDDFLALIDGDAEAFAPLAKAYSIPKDEPGRDEIMEDALRKATSVPMEIVEKCVEALDYIEVFREKGSKLAISDAGCAAKLCGAAMESAALNVYINSKAMKDRVYAESINDRLEQLLTIGKEKAESIYIEVTSELKNS